ncbi:MAG: PIN domain nuclease [Gammaproteobacteria bacterium]|nr:PIN domain nuclease [Gammaproteobacteria bacterium]
MILVDSSVWIQFFRGGGDDAPVKALRRLLVGGETVLAGDLIVAEVLQGFSAQRHFDAARRVFDGLPCVPLGGYDAAVRAAGLYRRLRSGGVTVRGVVDALIAEYCIHHGVTLLHSDRDFEPFERRLGLKVLR